MIFMIIEHDNKHFTKEEIINTPERIKRFHKEWEDNTNFPNEKFKFTTFPNPGYDQMIILKNIDFASMCSHHLLPFHGIAHIGYIPDKLICGISKLARVVDKFASRPQEQEKVTQDVANFLQDKLKPKGVMVVMEAQHDCMRIRGVKKQNSVMVTSAITNVFRKKGVKEEFLQLIYHK